MAKKEVLVAGSFMESLERLFADLYSILQTNPPITLPIINLLLEGERVFDRAASMYLAPSSSRYSMSVQCFDNQVFELFRRLIIQKHKAWRVHPKSVFNFLMAKKRVLEFTRTGSAYEDDVFWKENKECMKRFLLSLSEKAKQLKTKAIF